MCVCVCEGVCVCVCEGVIVCVCEGVPPTMEKRLMMSSACRLRVRNARQQRFLYFSNVSLSCS